jgi:hypothetical protein
MCKTHDGAICVETLSVEQVLGGVGESVGHGLLVTRVNAVHTIFSKINMVRDPFASHVAVYEHPCAVRPKLNIVCAVGFLGFLHIVDT